VLVSDAHGYSHQIVTAPVILFLGAGASASLGKPLMNEFLKSIEGTAADPQASELISIVRRARGDDLEAVMEDLQELRRFEYINSFAGETLDKDAMAVAWAARHYPGGPAPTGFQPDITKPFPISQSLVKRALLQVRDGIIREYGNVPEDRLHALYDPLFANVFRAIKRRCLPIFTTNYDLAIEQYCDTAPSPIINLVRGFRQRPISKTLSWSRTVFDEYVLPTEERNIVLFKLHGSADWVTEKGSKEITITPPVHHTDTRYENTVIYPATRKVAIEEPYSTAYDYFQRCCEHAKVCVAIGYSFRDYDTLTRLRSAARLNSDLNVVLISPQASDLELKLGAGINCECVEEPFDSTRGYEAALTLVLASVSA
jgi:hypothetical protein